MKVRAEKFWIARATAQCSECAATTPVISIVLPRAHETDGSDEIDESDDEAYVLRVGGWVGSDQSAFLFFVEQLSSRALERMQEVANHFRALSVADENGPGLRNHCAPCGAVFDDQDLVCEPGGPFLPTNESEAAAITLICIDEPIEASVAGYAYEPEFFKSMTRS